MNYWLMKSEPDVFSIEQLKKDKVTKWEGVRNYQARNFMMKNMQVGDSVLFYHSNASPSGLAGLAKVSRLARPDETQFNPKSEYFDPKATLDKPRWFCVEVEYVASFKHLISLDELKKYAQLSDMGVLKKGQRLSILPVLKDEFDFILSLDAKSQKVDRLELHSIQL